MVLIVDDHADTGLILQRLLRAAGWEAEYVASGPDALGRMSRTAPALVILDVMMPDMDGIEVLRAMRRSEHLERIPVLMYSATSARRTEALERGAQGYLLKGTDNWNALIEEIRKHARTPPASGDRPGQTRPN